MGWSPDTESKGTGFDSGLAQAIFGSLFCHVGVTFFMTLGMCWDVFGSTVGMFSDGFVEWGGEKLEEVEISTFSKMSGSIFPASGCP